MFFGVFWASVGVSRAETIDIARLNEIRTHYEVINLIIFYSKKYEVDFELAYNLAHFESRLKPDVKNPKSSATGIYQFLKSTWKENCKGDILNAEDNIKCGIRMLSEGGIGHWTVDPNTKRFLTLNGFLK